MSDWTRTPLGVRSGPIMQNESSSPAPLSAPAAAQFRVLPGYSNLVFRQAATMQGRRILALSTSRPFLFVPAAAPAGAVKLFTDAAAFSAFLASSEAAGFILRVHYYDGDACQVVFYDPTNAGRHVRAVSDSARFFRDGGDPTRDEGPGPGAAAIHAAKWAIIDAESALGAARLHLRLGILDFVPEDMRRVVKHAEQAAALLWQPVEVRK